MYTLFIQMKNSEFLKGRGAQVNSNNRFENNSYCREHTEAIDLPETLERKTEYIKVYPKTIVNKVTSPDTGMMFSLNPYQGCEHGCIYCYARNSHEYWGYNAGIDFESKILIKQNAVSLLDKKLRSKSWQANTIVLSGNTDCYQPIERKEQITRQLLKTFLKYRHPVSIITKNGLVLRDLDILKELNKHGLITVSISITSLHETTRHILEPRTASINKRLKTVEALSKEGIPVNVMIAPIIPGLNSHEIIPIAETASRLGALSIAHTVVRLNGAIADVFNNWVEKALPNKAEKIINQIKECHGGNLNDSEFGRRMRGEGVFAEQISKTMKLAKRKYFYGKKMPSLNCDLHAEFKTGQLSLF